MKFKVGDKVRLKKDCKQSFVIKNNNSGIKDLLKEYENFTISYVDPLYNIIGLKETGVWLWGDYWFEKAEEKPKPVFDDIKLSYCEGATVATHNGKIGMAFRSRHDKEDRKIGILIATMRALGFKKKTVDRVVDVLFDDIKELKDYTTEELLKEISNRIK